MIEKINITLITATAGGLVWIFTNFASAGDVERLERKIARDVEQLTISIAMGQYYDRLDDYHEAQDEGNAALEDEYGRQLETLRAEICLLRPDWERCDPDHAED